MLRNECKVLFSFSVSLNPSCTFLFFMQLTSASVMLLAFVRGCDVYLYGRGCFRLACRLFRRLGMGLAMGLTLDCSLDWV